MTELLVVGAGPAGMAAATVAAENGASVTLIDNRAEPGGNIYASLNTTRQLRPEIWKALGSSYREGAEIVDRFLSSPVNYLPGHSLWHLDPDGMASARSSDGTITFGAGKVVLATGAQERPMPLPGWTLAGVMGVGAAQILLKVGGDLPMGPIVIVGSGPLPLLYAAQVLEVGGSIAAIIEPASQKRGFGWISKIPGAWHGRNYLIKGIGYLAKRLFSRVPVFRNAESIQIFGENKVEGIQFQTNQRREIHAASILLHDGVVPNVNPAGAAGLNLERSSTQDCWVPLSNDNIRVAGDAGGILGAKSAKLSGIAAAHELFGEPVPAWVTSSLDRERQFQSFIDAMYPPIGSAALADAQTIICRCEAVTKQKIIDNVAACGSDPNRLKTNLRCGMGPCQGRMCGLSVESILSVANGTSKDRVGLHRLRNPIVPITIGQLARTKTNKD